MAHRVNLIPMAGEGKRFQDVGISIPKPLIQINGKSMVSRAVEALPKADNYIFICRDFHLKNNNMEEILKEGFENSEVITVSELTEGQACTCLLVETKLRSDDILTIGACDNTMTYDEETYESSLIDADVLVWTFRENPAVLQNPKMYGWVDCDENNSVKKVSVKIPISNTPMKDHAVIGAFTFKKAQFFIEGAKQMIDENSRINGEFYVDEVINFCIKAGLKVKVFEVDQYICWGTPQDLDIYNYWASYFQNAGF